MREARRWQSLANLVLRMRGKVVTVSHNRHLVEVPGYRSMLGTCCTVGEAISGQK